ncbi:heparinase II/III family protein [Amaricoccus sp.]|uniref:heparinase II/III family protein n=1 Tax=Amaricoccus sp. TaxID=1872485 RepID=UPI0026038B1B|nr:heparinase II/III family protein [Amaricoccus sp.]HRO12894.1 heparinase II/III family protein [Amaricoccus sp.]
MSSPALTLKALGEQIARLPRGWQNRIWAHRARLGGRPQVAETLPEPIFLGDADAGQALLDGRWPTLGREIPVGKGSIWAAPLTDRRLEAERQASLWLDDLAALGNRPARALAQAWVQDWITRFGHGGGPGWVPEAAGRRAKRWALHAALLTQGLDRGGADRFWRALAAHQRYLARAWPQAAEGPPRLRALAGLVWSGVVLPHPGHSAALAEMAALADALVDPEGGTPSRAPEDLAEILTLLIWTARLLDNAGQQAMAPHLSAIVRAVPVLRPLRMGDGGVARFHGGGAGTPERIDQALAELRLVAQPKPRLPMGFARLAGGRVVVVMDGAAPPAGPGALTAHAATLAFEMSAGRQRLVVNAGPGRAFGGDWTLLSRRTAAQSGIEVDGCSSARFPDRGLAARTFGTPLTDGPALVSVRQAQDATGQWLLATQDGYVASHGLLQERRLYVDARGQEVRGEDILTVPDAGARDRFERAAAAGRLGFAARFHLHPAVTPELDEGRQLVLLALPSGEVWMFRTGGGLLSLEDSVWFDPAAAAPLPTRQVVVRSEVVEYLGQVTWSFGRIAEARAAP